MPPHPPLRPFVRSLPLRPTTRLPQLTLLRLYSASSADPSRPTTLNVTSIPAIHTGVIRVLSLNRPAARNALSRQLVAELNHQLQNVLDEGESGPTRAIVIASAVDTAFCAGADLKERAGFSEAETKDFLASLRSTFSTLSSMPVPTITALSAPALGGGLELALCTHLRLFASTAVVGLPETRLAIIPGAGGTFRLPALIGEGRARDLILTGRRVGAPEAYFLGLCDRLVEVVPGSEESAEAVAKRARESVLREAVALAMDVCEGGPVAVRQALKAVAGWRDGGVSEGKAYEGVLGTADRNEALKAFKEKRKPIFKGR